MIWGGAGRSRPWASVRRTEADTRVLAWGSRCRCRSKERRAAMLREELKSPPGGPRHGKGMVAGVRAGGLLFFSAIRGQDPQTREFPDDTGAQARQALENLKMLLEGAGATLEHVVKVTLYL